MFFKKRSRDQTEINASSMADIAFLLLIFFLVTTTIVSDKGIPFVLPPKVDKEVIVDIPEQNVFKVILNSSDLLLVEDEAIEPSELKSKAIEFLDNNGRIKGLSDNPQKAIISFRADRGTSYDMYLKVLDELKGAYHVLRAQKLGITVNQYLTLTKEDSDHKKALEAARKWYPMQLSIAEPTKFGTK